MGKGLFQPFLAESRFKLIATIVVIDTVRKPDTLQIDFHCTKVVAVMTDGSVRVNSLQHLTDTEVILAKLVEGDVTPIERSLRQIVNELFLT